MLRSEILDLVNREQFQNFSIVTTAGVRYDITDPNAVALANDKFHYYFPKSDRVIHIPYNQIATVEETAAPKSKR
jgi:hypothetical protein